MFQQLAPLYLLMLRPRKTQRYNNSIIPIESDFYDQKSIRFFLRFTLDVLSIVCYDFMSIINIINSYAIIDRLIIVRNLLTNYVIEN